MRAVNLLPRETRSRSAGRVDPLLAGGAALTVAVVVAVGAGFVLTHSHAASAQKKLATARAELALLRQEASRASGATAPALPPPAVAQEVGPWQTALATALQTRIPWDGVLLQLARVVPANVTVTTVSLGGATIPNGSSGSTGSTPAPAATSGAPASLQIGGTAFSEDGVAQLLSRLALIPDLSNVVLTTSTADPKTGHVTFSISAQVSTAAISLAALSTGGTTS
jgi:Tfp pilus assembly protein PilN